MHKYRVVDLLANENRVEFRCQSGRHHFARALGVLPPANALLHGDKPHLGFGVLMCPQFNSMFRMIFESVNQIESELRPNVAQPLPSTAHRSTNANANANANASD